ncbi:hydroxyisourate hydrolase [Actinomycetospora sp. CA-084318]|uniref:hydroxyisourate hydrolase n=1 Tax=Actinomycetospora sp. CA-084318 TaxID=3239892 RepID=UPI003D97153F
MSLSTHVLDAVMGAPAAGLAVALERDGEVLVRARTDDDGRVRDLGAPVAGRHRLTFDTGAWFAAAGRATFYPEVVVTFEVTDPEAHHHVPLLLSPFAYSTYRGS